MPALLFDAAQRYCPDGKVPIAISDNSDIWELMAQNGDVVESEHWAPLGGEENGWVQVGWHEGETCKSYKRVFHEGPAWGLSGVEGTEVTGYLMCCLDPIGSTESAFATEASGTMAADTDKVIEQVDYIISQQFEPLLYDRHRGWEGSTYDEAAQFCSEREPARVLCPFEV